MAWGGRAGQMHGDQVPVLTRPEASAQGAGPLCTPPAQPHSETSAWVFESVWTQHFVNLCPWNSHGPHGSQDTPCQALTADWGLWRLRAGG